MLSFLKSRKEFDQKNINEPKGYIRAIWYKTLLIFLVIFVILASIVVLAEKISGENLKKEAIIYSTEQGLQIQRQLNQACSSIHAISAVLQLNTNYFANLKDFELFANNLLPSYPAVDSLQLAPNAVVKSIVPLEGNEKAIGHDLLNDMNRRDDVLKAIKTKELTL